MPAVPRPAVFCQCPLLPSAATAVEIPARYAARQPEEWPTRAACLLMASARTVQMPLVGRQREWATLQAVWQRTSQGFPQLLLLTGEAGIGKTRLAEELLAWLGKQGVAAVRARCHTADGGLAYAPIAAWLRAEPIWSSLSGLADVWLTEVARLVPELLTRHPTLPHPGLLDGSWQRL